MPTRANGETTRQQEDSLNTLAIAQDCDWDDEAIADAYARAEAIAEFDAEAATLLRQQARAAQRQRHGLRGVLPDEGNAGTPLKEPYDPMKLYARMGLKYPWMSDEVIDRMHFPKFFGYVREALLFEEEQQASYDRARRQAATSPTHAQPTLSPDEASGLFTQANVYQGEVTRYGG